MYGPGQGHHLQLSMGVCELSRHYWEISSYQGELFLCAAAPGNRNSRDYHRPAVIKQQIKGIAKTSPPIRWNLSLRDSELQISGNECCSVLSKVRRILKSTRLTAAAGSSQLSGSAIWVYLGCHNELELHVTALGAWRVLWTGRRIGNIIVLTCWHEIF